MVNMELCKLTYHRSVITVIFQGKLYFIDAILKSVYLTKSNVLIYYFNSRSHQYSVNGLRRCLCFCFRNRNDAEDQGGESTNNKNEHSSELVVREQKLIDERFKSKHGEKKDIDEHKPFVVVEDVEDKPYEFCPNR